MDRLSLALAISRGRRLYHGQPFVVFALDLRDPLGLHLTRLLHDLGDSRSVKQLQRRADRRDRAPVVVLPTSMEHLGGIEESLEESLELGTPDGCTLGDVNAVLAFACGARGSGDGVSVFLAAPDERSVFRFPLHRQAGQAPACPMDPFLFGHIFGQIGGDGPANTDDGTA